MRCALVTRYTRLPDYIATRRWDDRFSPPLPPQMGVFGKPSAAPEAAPASNGQSDSKQPPPTEVQPGAEQVRTMLFVFLYLRPDWFSFVVVVVHTSPFAFRARFRGVGRCPSIMTVDIWRLLRHRSPSTLNFLRASLVANRSKMGPLPSNYDALVVLSSPDSPLHFVDG